MERSDLDDLTTRLFTAFVAYDIETVAGMLATDATITQNGSSAPAAEALVAIAKLQHVVGNHSYQDVRRTFGEDTVVEEHQVVSVTPSGQPIDLAACVVIRVNGDGLISSLDEYVDTAPLIKHG